jgi:hypothetical protein
VCVGERELVRSHDSMLQEQVCSKTHMIEHYVAFVVFVCWLRLDFVPLSLVLGALGSLRLLSILAFRSVSSPRPCRL